MQRWGVRAARWYGRVLFACLYLLLIGTAAMLWFYHEEFNGVGIGRRIILGLVMGIMIVTGASVLTRMWLRYSANIDRYEKHLMER